MLTFDTALLGGAAIAVVFDHLANKSHNLQLIQQGLQGNAIDIVMQLCWFDWVYLAIWPIITLLGVFVQLSLTAVGLTHKTGD